MTTAPVIERPRPPYLWALLTGLVVLGIYIATLAPTTAFWDTSEYIAAAKVLGIPHPPGNPLFTIMAHTWGLIPWAASYAVRINLFAALTSAAAAAFWFLVSERWMQSIVPVRWVRLAASFAGVLVGATAWTVWNQSTVNEKVYTVSLFSIALMVWLAVHWADDQAGPHRDRWVVLMAYLVALTSTNHMMGVLAAPVIAVYVLWTDWRVLIRPKVVIAVIIALVVGVSLNYLYLPMRAAQYPPINEGEPIGFFSHALADVLNRAQYGKPSVLDRQADLLSQFGNYFQYWGWQFARDWGDTLRNLAMALFTVLGLVGWWELWRRDRRAAIASLTLFGTLVVALVYYLNFKYGFSYRAGDASLTREVRERDYFFVASFSAFSILVAVGFGTVIRGVVDFLSVRGTERSRWAMGTPVLLLALVPFFGNRITASRAHEWMARDAAVDLLESVEPYSILITAGDNDTFPLWYAQEVEGVRRDVTLANLSLMNTRWHLHQLRRRETPAFEPSKSVALWGHDTQGGGGRSWTRPTTPVFDLSIAALDSLPEVIAVPKNGGVRFDSLQISFGQEYLQLQDIATILLIKTNLGKRPIYFSWSDADYPDRTLGLTPYLLSQGLVRKLMPQRITPSDSIVLSQGLAYLDVPRTHALLWDVYHWKDAAKPRPRGWVDAPSASMLQLYTVVYGGMAATLYQMGDSTQAAKDEAVAQAVAANISGR